jgi:hypothetical protein
MFSAIGTQFFEFKNYFTGHKYQGMTISFMLEIDLTEIEKTA